MLYTLLNFMFLEPKVVSKGGNIVVSWQIRKRIFKPIVRVDIDGKDTILGASCEKGICISDTLKVKYPTRISVSLSVKDTFGITWISPKYSYNIGKNGYLLPGIFLGPFIYTDGSGNPNYNIVFWLKPYKRRTKVYLEIRSEDGKFRKRYRLKSVSRSGKYDARLRKLPPNTVFNYRITVIYRGETLRTRFYTFKTLSKGIDFYSFAFITNLASRGNEESPSQRINGIKCDLLQRFLTIARVKGVEIVFLGGNIIQKSPDTIIAGIQYRTLLKCIEPFANSIPVMVVMGENENLSPYKKTKKGIIPLVKRSRRWFLFSKILSPETFFAYYITNPYTSPRSHRYMRNTFYVRYEGDLFVVLNSLKDYKRSPSVDRTSFKWLENHLEFRRKRYRNVYLMMYHPVDSLRNREKMLKLIERYNIKGIFSALNYEKVKVHKETFQVSLNSGELKRMLICDSAVSVKCYIYNLWGELVDTLKW